MAKKNILRYAVILTDYKKYRYIIASIEKAEYPLVFLREWIDDPYAKGDYYTLYINALTVEQAAEILDKMKEGDVRRARMLLKRWIKNASSYCDEVGTVVLDDQIPDKWYDAWKHMKHIITSYQHITGYWEEEYEELRP